MARLDRSTDGRPDPRPDVRENEKALGNLLSEFNFKQTPRKPAILNPNPTGQVNLIGPTTVGRAGTNPLTVDSECPAASGSVAGEKLGPVTLGATRARLRGRLSHYSKLRNRRFDDFCLLGGEGIRVGYLSGQAALAMTANPHYAYRKIRAGTRVTVALRRLGRGVSGPLRRGVTRWYAQPLASAVLLVKAQGGVVREIGLASHRRAGTAAARRWLLDALRA